MIRKFFFSKVFVLFAVMLVIGFSAGYYYSISTSKGCDIAFIKNPQGIAIENIEDDEIQDDEIQDGSSKE